MSRQETKRKLKSLRKALKLNRGVIENNKSPHERDIARYRITLLKDKIRGL